MREATPLIHAGALRPWGSTLLWAWPHDGLAHDKTSGEQLAQSYRRHGLNLLAEKAAFENGSAGAEAGVFMMQDQPRTDARARCDLFRCCIFSEATNRYARNVAPPISTRRSPKSIAARREGGFETRPYTR
jgi:hypothetical protein